MKEIALHLKDFTFSQDGSSDSSDSFFDELPDDLGIPYGSQLNLLPSREFAQACSMTRMILFHSLSVN